MLLVMNHNFMIITPAGDAPEVLLGDVSCPPCTTVGLVFLCAEAPLLT